MIKFFGELFVNTAFLCIILAAVSYFIYSLNDEEQYYKIANWLFGVQGIFLLASVGMLLYIVLTHQFNFYYVFKYTSRDLQLKYLISAFWGGQEGSFMLWMIFSTIVGFGLMRWTRKPYRGPVMFFLVLTQIFLYAMISGIHFGSFTLGASPFRTLAEAMPNAPFLQSNPNFVPQDGQGLNDLLKSPWMVIHPPILFFGFSMMTVPYCFAMAALWKRKYQDWVGPALPWTLGSNIALLTAIFLGGYWAYVTLSFGGYWAWDPVENAAFVPWLIGTAGIHMMIIQRKNTTGQKASIIFAILAYLAIVYETFLTRSGVLADSSVHSFVDLGLYNQLLIFMAVISTIGIGMIIYRYKDLPTPDRKTKLLSREFMTFIGAMLLFLIGLVILIGTSSPVIGHLFVNNPTPPDVSFYNQWTMPLAMLAALLTVFGQYLFWKRHDAESLANELTWPVVITCVLTLATIMIANIRSIYYMFYLFTAWFALIGNAFIMVRLLMKKPKLIGGALTHVGFGILLLGILASSAYDSHLLDSQMKRFNHAVKEGKARDADGVPVTQKRDFFELKLNQPKVVNNKYKVTYKGYTLKNQARPGQQQYHIVFQPLHDSTASFSLRPQVYPMMSSSRGGNIQWSVDPDVYSRLKDDVYLYVSGSSYVEYKNKQAKQKKSVAQQASVTTKEDTSDAQKVTLKRGDSVPIGRYKLKFDDYQQVNAKNLPDSTVIAIRAHLEFTQRGSDNTQAVDPLYVIYQKNGKSWSYTPPKAIPETDATVQFSNINPSSGEVDLKFRGVDTKIKQPWILLTVAEKPFISVVWFGTFLLMAGFSVSIFRHWGRERKKS